MSTEQRKVDALQLIFSVFLGILLVVVIGVGVWTFYPQPFGPNSPEQERLEELYKEQEMLGRTSEKAPSTAEQDAEFRRIQDEIDEVNDAMSDRRDSWAVGTSIILLSFATLLMAVSLFLPEHVRVFSNGVLLGGVFTVIYGTGWSFAGGDTRARFWVVLVALGLSVLFGYLRFVRRREGRDAAPSASLAGSAAAVPPRAPSAADGTAAAPEDAAALASLTARVEALEARAAAAADALRGADRA